MASGDDRTLDSLTAREREVLVLVRRGLTNEEIARQLEITLDGAKYHVSQILSKLSVASREEAAALVVPRARGWVRKLVPLGLFGKLAGVAVVAAALAGLGVLLWGVLASDDGEGEVAVGSSVPPAPTVVGSFDDPNDFRSFARALSGAIESRNASFFEKNVVFEPFECGSGFPASPASCDAEPPGSSVDAIIVGVIQAEGFALNPPGYSQFIESFLGGFDSNASDEYGGSEPKLYAYGIRREDVGGPPPRSDEVEAIATSVISEPVPGFPPTGRALRVFRTRFQDERWVIAGIAIGGGDLDPQTVSAFLAAPNQPDTSQLFDFWRRWESGVAPTPPPSPAMARPDLPGYRDDIHGFVLTFPEGALRPAIPAATSEYDRIDLPFEAGTNLVEKYVEVSARDVDGACASPRIGDNPHSETVEIGGQWFLREGRTGAATGNRYQFTAFSISREEICVSLTFVLHSVAPVMPNPSTDFDQIAESAVFEEIVSTFRWLP